jgi:hypothetical protein
MISLSDGFTDLVYMNPELSICYQFLVKMFGFFNTNKWLCWHFFCMHILILKQESVSRRSKQAANLLKKIQDSQKQGL